MINKPVVITSDFSILQKNASEIGKDIVIAFEISSNSFFQQFDLNKLHKSPLLKSKDLYFSFFINTKHDSDTQKVMHDKAAFLHYFFHPQFYKKTNQPVLFSYNEIENKFYSEINSMVKEQGYTGLEMIRFASNPKNKNEHYCINEITSPQKATDIYSSLLKDNYYSSKYIGVSTSNFIEIINVLIETEERIALENINLYNFLLTNIELQKKNSLLAQELEQTKIDLQNQTTYLDFYKNKDESLKIYHFYHNEYEILPLWYKKLGHILKVIMGKRSFRSLFDSNVKKYKD